MPFPYSPQEWRQLEPLVDELLDTPPEQRATRMTALGVIDEDQRAELDRLIAECQGRHSLFEAPAAERFAGLFDDPALESGHVLASRYRITRELERGGMAVVYLAHDLAHGRDVAVKVLAPIASAAVGADRFSREIRVVAQLTHPHILPLFDSGEARIDRSEETHLWYTMPFIAGESLRARLKRERQLPVADAARIASDVADALDFAHRQGVIHRDIKPENILLHDGHALVADFGIARAIDLEPDGQLTGAGVLIGTPAYMSPEQASGRELDGRTDIYSLGCVLYEMLTGSPPFVGATPAATVALALSGTPHPVGLTRPAAVALEPVVARAMARVPADRYESGRAMLQALAEATTRPTAGITPVGEQRMAPPRPHGWGARLGWLGLAVAATAALIALWPGTPTAAGTVPRIAVLPLQLFGASHRDSTLANVMVEELIRDLGHEPDRLRAISYGSVLPFRDRGIDVRVIAESLGVTYILDPSLQRIDARGRLTVTLIDGRDRSVRWTAPYDGEYVDLLARHGTIAQSVARALGIRLRRFEGSTVLASRSEHADDSPQRLASRDLILEAARPELFRTDSGRRLVFERFTQAVRMDPTHALAHAHLSLCLAGPCPDVGRPRVERQALAEDHARRAMALDSLLPDAHFALGRVFLSRFDFANAERVLKRGIELDPTNSSLRQELIWLHVFMGRRLDALEGAEQLLIDNPASPNVIVELARALLVNGRCDEALDQLERLRHLAPPPARAAHIRSQCYLAGQQWQAAIEVERENAARNPSVADANLAFTLARAGAPDEARRILERLLGRWREGRVGAYDVARVYAGLREIDQAFAWLDRAVDDRSLRFDVMEPGFSDLHRDPRFDTLRARLGIQNR